MIRLNTSALCRSTTALLSLFISSISFAQNAPTPAGNWEGGIDVGGNKLGVVFVITQREGANYETVMSVPSQSPKGIACNQTIVNGDSLIVSVKMIGGHFKGKINAGRSSVFGKPWFRYFIQYDPAVNLKQARCPVLALNGEKDYQVPSAMNLTAIGAALKGHHKRVTTKEIRGLNHLFQHCQTCTGAEYAQLSETFAPEALQLMGDWILTEGLR